MIYVVDASAMAEYVLRTPAYDEIRFLIEARDADCHAPALCDVEVASAMRSLLLARRVTAERAALALEAYRDLPLTRHDHPLLLPRILELRANFSAYDATYVALCEALDAALITADARLARAVRRHTDVAIAWPS